MQTVGSSVWGTTPAWPKPWKKHNKHWIQKRIGQRIKLSFSSMLRQWRSLSHHSDHTRCNGQKKQNRTYSKRHPLYPCAAMCANHRKSTAVKSTWKRPSSNEDQEIIVLGAWSYIQRENWKEKWKVKCTEGRRNSIRSATPYPLLQARHGESLEWKLSITKYHKETHSCSSRALPVWLGADLNYVWR